MFRMVLEGAQHVGEGHRCGGATAAHPLTLSSAELQVMSGEDFLDVVSNVFIHRDDLNQVARSNFSRLSLNSFVRLQV